MDIIAFLGAMIGFRIWIKVERIAFVSSSERILRILHIIGISVSSKKSLHPI
jgi:hypothetical protein